jgi:hypothetical protein
MESEIVDDDMPSWKYKWDLPSAASAFQPRETLTDLEQELERQSKIECAESTLTAEEEEGLFSKLSLVPMLV